MKLATYTPQVQRNTISNASVDAPAAQALANIGRMQAQGLTGIANTFIRVGEQIDSVNVQAASNEYTKRLNNLLYNQDNGLMNTKMQGADGITAKFEEEERKIRQEVGSQFKFFSPKGTMVFNRMTDNTATQRFELVRRHQTQQYNAYREQTYDNALGLNVQTAADNYTMPEVVAQNVAEALATTRMRYAGQGEEVIKAEEKKAVGGITQQVIGRAYANGDYASAERYLNQYRKSLPPEQYTLLKKNVSNVIQAEKQTASLTELAKQYTDLPTYLQKVGELYDSTHFDGVEGYNMPTQGARIDEQVKQLTPQFRAALPAIGGILKHKFGLDAVISSGARTREHQMEINPSAPNSHHIIRENGGDAVDIVLPDGTTPEQYKKIEEYFKNSGAFAEVLNHDVGSGYHLHLGGYRGGLDKKASPIERKKFMQAAMAEFNNQRHLQNMMMTQAAENFESQLFQMYKTGGSMDPVAVNAMVMNAAGNNPKLFRNLTAIAHSYTRVANGASRASGGSGGSGGSGSRAKSDPLLEYKLTNMLNNGVSRTAVLEFMDNPENGFSPNDKAKALAVLEKYDTGKGQFAYDWEGIKDVVMADYKAKDKAYAWGNVQQKLIYDINAYKAQHNGQDPDRATVVQWGRQALVEGISYSVPGKLFGTTTKKTNLATAAAHGIYNVVDNPSGGKNITLKDGRTITVTDAQYARIIEQNMSVEQAINAG